MPRFPRILPAILAALAALTGPLPAAAQSPEFFQILNEVNGSLKVLGPSMTRGPVCAPMMVDQAKQGLQGNLFSSAANKIVIEPLEAGAKVALGAAGVPGAAISTYSAVRCGMSAADGKDFVRCLLGEAVGLRGGELLENLGVDSLEGAITGFAWDQAYASMRGAIEGYGATSESVEWSASGECSIEVTAQWNKRRQPGAEGGQVVVIARASNCRCKAANELRQGSLRFVVPVKLLPTGARQPGFSAGEPRQYNLSVVCCGGPAERTIGVLPGGGLAPPPGTEPPATTPPKAPPRPPRTPTGGGTPPAAIPGSPPARPPATPPAGPASGRAPGAPAPGLPWSVANPCPACQPLALRLRESEAEERRLAPELAKARTALRRTMDEIFDARKRIAEIESRLGAMAGTGGSGTDPGTGITTSSVVQPDGTVRITRTGRDGKVIDTSTRPYATATRLRAELAAEQARLAAAQAAEPGQVREVSRLDEALRAAERNTNALRAELAACVEERCRGGVADERGVGVLGGGPGPGPAGGTAGDKPPGPKETRRRSKDGGKPGGGKAPPPADATPPAEVPPATCRPCETLRQAAQELKDALDRTTARIAEKAAREAEAERARDDYLMQLIYLVARSPELVNPDFFRTDPSTGKRVLKAEQELRNVDPELARLERRANNASDSAELERMSERRLRREFDAAVARLHDCLRLCRDLFPEVQTATGLLGNNPFDPRNPLGGRRTGGTPIEPPQPGQPGSLSLSLTAYQAGEGSVAPITVQRLGGRTGAVSVQYATAGGSATEGGDYARAAGTLAWADGEDAPKTFAIQILQDTLVEGPESFTVTLSGATGGATIAPIGTATVTVADDDLPPVPQPAGSIQFQQSESAVTEGGTALLTVTRTGGSAGAVSVGYNTGAGSAQSGADYTAASGTLTWADGDASPRTITVATIDDTVVESSETFFVNISNPTGGATLGNPNVVVATILDNDVAGPCGPAGNAWQPNTGAAYNCSGSCSPSPTPQTVSVSGTTVTVSPFHAGGPATFTGCTASLNSDSSTLTYFSQAIHRATITRTGNNGYSAAITASTGATCSFTCSRSGP